MNYLHLALGVGVYDLVSEGAIWEVGSLRDVEDLLNVGLVDLSSEDRPQFSEDSKQGALSAAIGSSDHQVHSWLDTEVHLLD